NFQSNLVYAITKPAGETSGFCKEVENLRISLYDRSPRGTGGSNGDRTRSRKKQLHRQLRWQQCQSTAGSGAAGHFEDQLARSSLQGPKSRYLRVARYPSANPCPTKKTCAGVRSGVPTRS